MSLRRHYLKLATWFDAATPLDAHALAAAAFGLYGVRHLGVVLDEDIAEAVPATMSWWQSPRAPVPVSQRERGDRTARGSASRPPDHTDQKRLLLAARAAEAQRRESACAELLAVGGHLAEARLSGGAMSVLLELLSNATSDGQATLPDHDVRLHVTASPGSMQITSDLGDLVVEERALVIGPASATCCRPSRCRCRRARRCARGGSVNDDERRDAARLLLSTPLVLAERDPDGHRSIRRHADTLAAMFRNYLGYRLVVEAQFARLYKAGLGSAGRPLLRRSKAVFSPRDYTYLALLCAVLLTSRQQVLLSTVVADVRHAAAEADIDLGDDTLTERRALVHALGRLIEWGVVHEDAGTVAEFADDPAKEALLWIEHEIVRNLLAIPLREVESPEQLIRRGHRDGS